MPKLPDIEYGVVSQGPPNTAQAWGAVSDAIARLGQVGAQAQLAYAEGIARSQKAAAQLKFDTGMGQDEAILSAKAYLSPRVVREALGESIPASVQKVLDAHQDNDAETIPTWQIKPAFHAARAKALAAEVAQGIQFPKAREEWLQTADAQAAHRNSQITMSALREGAEVERASAAVRYELRAKFVDPADTTKRAEITADIQNDPWLTPKDKVQLHAQNEANWTLEGKKQKSARMAEFALSTGRDGITPWVDAATATANFEQLAAKEKDPLVVEEARTRFNNALHQNIQARDAADAPALGRLSVEIDSGRGLLKTSEDYRNLSDVGKAKATAHANAYLRSKRAEGAQERLLQNQIDALADAYWKSLDATGKPGADKETIKIDRDNPYFKDASPKVLLTLTGHQKDVRLAVAKDQGVSLQEFTKEAKTIAEGMGWDLRPGQQGALFVDAMEVAWTKWKNDPANAGKPVPSDEEAYQMFRKALRAGERDRSAGFWQPNMYAWEAYKSGVPFTSEGFSDQPGLALLEARRRELGKSLAAATGPTPNDPTKPILLNPDGSWSTEKTMTFEVDGKHVVLPTIVAGKEVSGDEALKLFRSGKNPPVGSFDSAKEANEYAQKRHEEEQRLRADEAAFLLDFKSRYPNQPLPTPAEVKKFLPAWKAKKAGAK